MLFSNVDLEVKRNSIESKNRGTINIMPMTSGVNELIQIEKDYDGEGLIRNIKACIKYRDIVVRPNKIYKPYLYASYEGYCYGDNEIYLLLDTFGYKRFDYNSKITVSDISKIDVINIYYSHNLSQTCQWGTYILKLHKNVTSLILIIRDTSGKENYLIIDGGDIAIHDLAYIRLMNNKKLKDMDEWKVIDNNDIIKYSEGMGYRND